MGSDRKLSVGQKKRWNFDVAIPREAERFRPLSIASPAPHSPYVATKKPPGTHLKNDFRHRHR